MVPIVAIWWLLWAQPAQLVVTCGGARLGEVVGPMVVDAACTVTYRGFQIEDLTRDQLVQAFRFTLTEINKQRWDEQVAVQRLLFGPKAVRKGRAR